MMPFEDVARDGDRLIVHRNADISRYCLTCAKLSDGKRIASHLRMDKSGLGHKTPLQNLPLWFSAIEFLLYLSSFIFDFSASRKRKLTYGLCAAHHRQRLLMVWGLPLAVVFGIAFLSYGLASSASTYIEMPAVMIGIGLLFTVFFTTGSVPGPQLAGQNENYLWIRGVGKKFLDAHPAQVHAPAPKK